MASGDNEVRMMMSVYPGAMTGFAAMNAGLSSILNVFNGMTRAFDQQFGLVDAALTTTSVVVTQLGVDAMNAFGQFEQGMKIVQMVSNQTSQEMDVLKQKANEFSVEYRMDIDQITEGLQTLGRAGLNSATEQAEVLENGLYTAKLEGRDLNSVLQELLQNTTLLGGSLKSDEFGEQTQYVNDLLVATSMTAPITTHDISETLKYSGGIAAAAGAKIDTDEGQAILEDYMGAIAAFAQKGVTGSIAGTALRAFLNKPATQDSSVVDALASIHLKPEYLWEEGGEVMKPISEQIALIKGQMEELNVSTMDQLQIWSKIVGGKMGQQMMKLDAEDIKEVSKDIQAADSASNLAAGSMKTYEANIKQAKESMALLNREVGEKLVSIVNPWIEFANKILEFLSNDFMSMPLAGGVIAFVGYLFTQIRRIASTVRSEISSLLGLTKDARALIHQSMTGRAQMDEKEVGPFVAMKKSSSKQATQIAKAEAGQAAAEGFKEFNTQYNKQLAAVSKLSYGALVDAGVTGDKMGVVAALQTIKKTDSFGLRPQDYVAAGMVTGTLPKGMEEELIKARKGGLTGRSLIDTVIGKDGSKELNGFMAHIRTSSENLKLLGISAEQAAAKMSGTSDSGKFRYGSWHDSERQARTKSLLESRSAAQEAALAEERKTKATVDETAVENAAVKGAEAHATAISGETAATEAAEMAALALEEALNSFVPASQRFTQSIKGISTSISVNPLNINNDFLNQNNLFSRLLYNNASSILPGFSNIPRNLLNTPFIPFSDLNSSFAGQRINDDVANSLKSHDLELMQQRADYLYGKPAPILGEGDSAAIRIDKALMTKRLQPAFDAIDEGTARHMNNLVQKSMTQNLQSNIGSIGAGALPGVIASSNVFSEQPILIPRSGIENMMLGSGIEAEKELMIEEQNLAVVEQIFRELLNIASRLTKTRMVQDLRESTAKADAESSLRAENRRAMVQAIDNVKDNAKAANKFIEQNTYNQKDFLRGRNALAGAGTGYPTRMNTSQPEQVHKGGDSSFVGSRRGYNPVEAKHLDKLHNSLEKKSNSLVERVNAIAQQNQGKSSSYMDSVNKSRVQLAEAIKSDTEAAKSIQPGSKLSLQRAGYLQSLFMSSGTPQQSVQQQEILSGGLWSSVTGRWNADRAGRINFGTIEGADGQLRSVTKGLRGMGNGLLNMTDLIGGPVMIAFMAIPALINMWKGAFEDFCNDLKEAGDKVKEAYSEISSAEDSLKQTYREGNPEATEEEINDMILDSYGTLYDDLTTNHKQFIEKASRAAAIPDKYEYDTEKDDGSTKVKQEEVDSQEQYNEAIKENTAALYAATAQLNNALNVYTQKMTDSWWGLDGWTGQISDAAGKRADSWWGDGTTFNSKGGSFLLTTSQQDENYSGYTEMAGLMLEDMKDANGNWIAGMRTMMGDDVDFYSSILGTHTPGDDFMRASAKFASQDLGPQQNARLQASMKNDSKTWKSLAKELAKYENKNKKSYDVNKKESNKIQNLIKKLQTTLGSGFDATKVLQAAYLQVAQDMFAVAQTVFVPLIQQNATFAAQTVAGVGQVYNTTGGTGTNTYNTAAIASSIAALLGTIALAQAGDAARTQAMIGGDLDGDNEVSDAERRIHNLALDTNSGDEFMREALKQSKGDRNLYNLGSILKGVPISGIQGLGGGIQELSYLGGDRSAADYLAKVYGVTTYMTTRGMDSQAATDAINKYVDQKIKEGVSPEAIIKTLGKNWTAPGFVQQIEDAYLNSEDDTGSGSGSGGSGSGSGNKDKDTGTKKERVDLVLCNKKEIPKLNVNLFKKAPSFTILNKNFKLRDIKVNTQDKPKAVLASIKNAIIDVQKRTDPKIIQDEEAIYDPVGATDGNTPSGTSDVRTDSN